MAVYAEEATSNQITYAFDLPSYIPLCVFRVQNLGTNHLEDFIVDVMV